MTEAEWLSCNDPEELLNFLRGKASERKLRLLACGCVRRLWPLVYDERGRQAVAAVEQLSDGGAAAAELSLARRAALKALADSPESRPAARPLAEAVLSLTDADAMNAARTGVALLHFTHRHLLHDVFGNPFRKAVLDPAWLAWEGGTLGNLARGIYDQRDFDQLPILGDALEEAGCTNPDILGHLRGPGPHVRGCWAVDLLLGKS
jgi:hypothetical protein